MKSDRSISSSKDRGKWQRSKLADMMLKQVIFLTSTAVIALLFVVMKILDFVPYFRRKIVKSFEALSALKENQFEGCIWTWEMYKTVIYDLQQDIFKTAEVGEHAPNVQLYRIQSTAAETFEISESSGSDRTERALRSSDGSPQTDATSLRCLMRPGVPLVLNFGSCS